MRNKTVLLKQFAKKESNPSTLTDIMKRHFNRCGVGERRVFGQDHKTEDEWESIDSHDQIHLLQ